MIFCDFGVLEGALCGHFELQILFRSHRGPNCSQKSHLGIPGWSGIGFRVILGYLWTSLWEVNFQVFRQAADLGRFFLGTFVRCFVGRLFGRFYIDGLIPGDVKSTQNHGGLFKIKVSRKSQKYVF